MVSSEAKKLWDRENPSVLRFKQALIGQLEQIGREVEKRDHQQHQHDAPTNPGDQDLARLAGVEEKIVRRVPEAPDPLRDGG